MSEIMTRLHQYVPQFTYLQERYVSNGTVERIEKAKMHFLLGGDQLTTARARNIIKGKRHILIYTNNNLLQESLLLYANLPSLK